MDIPVNAVVYCADGICGRSAYAVLNPVTDQVTHMVVEEKRLPHTQRIVPIDDVMETAHDRIRLRCTGDELAHMQVFSETKFLDLELPEYEGPRFQMWPTLIPKTMRVL